MKPTSSGKRRDWRQIAWHVGVRDKTARTKEERGKWTLTSNHWFFTRGACAKYIREEIIIANWDKYEYKPIKCVMVQP